MAGKEPVSRRFAFKLVFPALALCTLLGCKPQFDYSADHIVTTIPPAAAIVSAIVGDSIEVTSLLPPGASPHAYELRPSDARKTESAIALVLADPALDGWASRLPHREILVMHGADADATAAHGKEHSHDENPHFWTDPVRVAELVPEWTRELSDLAPEHADAIQKNGDAFSLRLNALHEEIVRLMEPHRGKAVVAFHGSFDLFFERYGLRRVALIEPVPGQESSPKHLERLIKLVRDEDIKALFMEPQLPIRPAEVLAAETGAMLVELDPLGSVGPADDYVALIRWNAERIAEALR